MDISEPSFVLPEIYMPYPVKVNAHLAELRRNSESWARRMGMLEGGEQNPDWAVWKNIEKFHAIALPELAAFCFPAASVSNLTLIHEICVWLLAFDDHFTQEFKIPGDISGARRYADRMRSLLPHLPGTPPDPVNAAEKGLLDLRIRMASAASPRSLRTWCTGISRFIEGACWELENICAARVPDPIEFVQMRRWTFASYSSASYVDLSTESELPERIMETRPIAALLDAMMDWMGLSNDIFSYQREIKSEGEVSNLVLVLEHFLRVGPQQAVHAANDLLTARLHHLDHIVDAEVPPLMDEHHLSPDERAAVTSWIEGGRSYLAGLVAWTDCAARYAPGAL